MGFKKQNLQYGTYYSSNPDGGSNGKKTRLIIIGLIVAAVIGGVLLFLSTAGGSLKNDLNQLAAKENSLLALANTSQKSIRDPDLATVNSNTSILLTSDVATLLKASGVKKVPDDLAKQAADTNGDKLKEAALLNKFDITYRQVALDKVTALITDTERVRTSTSSQKTRAMLDQILVNLNSINKQLTALSLQ